MALADLTKGSKVEVSSDDEGFQGAWYVATLVDVVKLSPTKKKSSGKKSRGRKKSGYLVKYDTLFEENDAKKQLTEVVKRSFVRPIPPRNLRRNNDNEAVEEAEEGGGDFELHDVVDAYHRDGWWIGEVKKKVIVEGEIKKYVVFFDSPPEEFEFERSRIRHHVEWIDCKWKFPPKKTPSTGSFTSLDLNRPVSGKRKRHSESGEIPETNDKTAGDMEISCDKSLEPFTGVDNIGSNGNTEVTVSATVSLAIMETPEVQVVKRQSNRKKGRPRKFPIQTSNCSNEANQEVWNTINEMNNELDEQPLSVWYEGLHPVSVLKRSCCRTPDLPIDALNQAIVKTTIELPFIKQSPIWATIESLDLYQKPPQRPHFSPLKDVKEDYREGLAIAHMVTFANIVQRISKLQFTDEVNLFENSLEALVDLETHGFDVGAARARLHELLSAKASVSQLNEELKEAENKIEKHNQEKAIIEKEINELALKLQELQEKLVKNVKMKNEKDAEITILRENLQFVSKQIKDHKLAFNILAASPL